MQRPRVTLHTLTSLDGRLDGFPPDVALYYDLASALPHQAVLTGTGTLLAAAANAGIDMAAEEAPPDGESVVAADDPRPLMVVVDSGGALVQHAAGRARLVAVHVAGLALRPAHDRRSDLSAAGHGAIRASGLDPRVGYPMW